jgi:hypothetical protein
MAGAKRTWVVEPGYDPETGDVTDGYDRAEALQTLRDLEATLYRVGGMVSMAADRVRSGEAPDGSPLATSERLIITWQAFSPLREPAAVEPVVPEIGLDDLPGEAPPPTDVDDLELEDEEELGEPDELDAEWSPDDEPAAAGKE